MTRQDNFYRRKLKNGLTVLFEKRNLPVVSISSSVKYGSIYEPFSIKGIAHLIEHLAFKGTKKRTHDELVEEIEKRGGILNAYTSEEFTCFWSKLPSKHVETGINITSDLILNPKFDQLEFEKEKKVVIEEIKMYNDNPALHSLNKIKELLYKKPFGMLGTGTIASVNRISRKEVTNLFNNVYSTNAEILCIVGDADFNEICELAEEIYPGKKRKGIDYSSVKINSNLIEKRKGLGQAHFVFGFHAPEMKDRKRYAYEIAGSYLFNGMSSVLFKEIREKRGLAYAVKGGFDLGKKYGYGFIYLGTLKEKIKEIKEIILREIKNLKNLKQKDFEECKEQLIGIKKVEEEDSTNTMNSLIQEEVSGNAENYYKYEENINKVKLKNIKDIKLKNYSTFSLIPD